LRNPEIGDFIRVNFLHQISLDSKKSYDNLVYF
jgi:hypothetical protein